ncbi:hypothetical protein HY417_03165 [Candidatus Kaiserbacteria bacterium]|nr:hypothetical protein [Candidatus Kaiserbacteria bacterium]
MPPAAAPASRISVGSFVRFGWETFKKRGWFLVGAVLIFGIASVVASFVNGVVTSVIVEAVGSGAGTIIGFVAGMAVNAIINLGWIAFLLKAHDDIASVSFSDLWHPQKFWSFLGATLLYSIIVFVGYIFLIVPGVIASVAFFFAPWLVVDKGLTPIEALKASARITKGNRLRVFALMAASMLVSFLGVLALIVGLLIAIPIVTLAAASAYRRLSAAESARETPQRLRGGEVTLLIAGLLIPIVVVIGMSSVVLGSLNVAREKSAAAQAAADLKMVQLGLELYALQHGSYPAALSEIASDPQVADALGAISPENFSYAFEDGSYILCSNEPTLEGDECVTPEDLDSSQTQP